MSKLVQVTNGEYIGANKYTIKDAGGGKSTVDFSPDSVIKEGTPVGAELLNEIQKNSIPSLEAVRRIEGQDEVYDCQVEGIDTFVFDKINFIVNFDLTNTKTTPFLRIGLLKYPIKFLEKTLNLGDLDSGNRVLLVLDKAKQIANIVSFLSDNKNKANVVATIEELKSSTRYKVGDIVEVLGYYAKGDGADHKRKIENADDGSGVQLANGLWANIVHSGEVCVSWFGAKGDGVTDDSPPFIKSLKFKNVILDIDIVLKKIVYLNDDVNLVGNGKSITQSDNYLTRTKDDGTLKVKGVIFKGEGVGLNSSIQNYEGREQNLSFIIEDCVFENLNFGINLYGLREGYIKKCRFEKKNKGIKRTKTVNTFVVDCYFKDTEYMVLDDGDDSAYSCGLRISNSVALGCTYGVVSYGVDQCDIQNNMIDYCDNPIVFRGGIEGSIIANNYITSRNSLYVIDINKTKENIIDKNKLILIYGNTLINHSSNGRIANLADINSILEFNNNICHFYTDLALNLTNIESGVINGNYFRKRNTYTETSNTIDFNNCNTIYSFSENDYVEENLNEGAIKYKLNRNGGVINIDYVTSTKKSTFSRGADMTGTLGVGSFSDAAVPLNFFRGGVVGAGFYLEALPSSNNQGILNLTCKQFKVNGTVIGASTIQQLDTPYYAQKMQEEGVYDDFKDYMDRKLEYDRQQRELEQQRQQAFEESGTDNYEEWLATQPMALSLIGEPVPSEKLMEFKIKYLG